MEATTMCDAIIRDGRPGPAAPAAAIVALTAVCLAMITAMALAAADGPAAGVYGRGTTRPAGTDQASAEAARAMKEEAARLVEQVLAAFPDDPQAMVLAGNTCHWLGRSDEAMAHWQKSLEAAPNRADVMYAMSRLALRKDRPNEARQWALKALAIAPKMPGVRTTLAAALITMGRPEQAIPLLEAEVRLVPGAVHSHYLLGRACFETGDYTRAKRQYEAVLAARPNHKNACYGLATVCARLGETERARLYRERFQGIKEEDLDTLIEDTTSFDDAATIRPALAATHFDAALVWMAHERPDTAETHWRRAAELDEAAIAPREFLASLCAADERYDEALAFYARLRELEPGNPAHLVGIGTVHLRREAYEAAEQAFVEARRLAPERALGHRALAQFYLSTDRNAARALELARMAVRLEPVAVNYFVFAEALAKNGRTDEAVRAMRQAVLLDPANPVYRRVYDQLRNRP
jgi:tetratricopeptide (TPR) repeat protein